MDALIAAIVGLITGLGGGAGIYRLLTFRRQVLRDAAETNKAAIEATAVRERITDLIITRANNEIDRLMAENARLRQQLAECRETIRDIDDNMSQD